MKESSSLIAPGREPSAAVRPIAGFTARITAVRLHDLVRLQCLAESTGVFLVISGDQSGLLHFARGELVHAETSELQGEPAALEILSWERGEFASTEHSLDTTVSVSASVDALLARPAPDLEGRSLRERSLATATGIRRRMPASVPESSRMRVGPEVAEPEPGSGLARDLRAAATPGIAAAPAPHRSLQTGAGRSVANAFVSPRGELLEGHGPDAEALAAHVSYIARLSEIIGQAMGAGETRSVRVRGADAELSVHRHPDGHLFGSLIAPEARNISVSTELSSGPPSTKLSHHS